MPDLKREREGEVKSTSMEGKVVIGEGVLGISGRISQGKSCSWRKWMTLLVEKTFPLVYFSPSSHWEGPIQVLDNRKQLWPRKGGEL